MKAIDFKRRNDLPSNLEQLLGQWGESKVLHWLIDRGHESAQVNFRAIDIMTHVCHHDLFFNVSIQVKTGTLQYDKRKAKPRKFFHFHTSKGSKSKQPYREGDFDLFAFCGYENEQIYFVPRWEVNQLTMNVREESFDIPNLSNASFKNSLDKMYTRLIQSQVA